MAKESKPKEEIEKVKVEKAIEKAVRPTKGVYSLNLVDPESGDSLGVVEVPWKVVPHALGLQAQRGEQYIDTDEDTIDDQRTVRQFVKKANMGLLGGWKIVNDLSNSPNPPKGDLEHKMIGVSWITTEDWIMIESLLFPGNNLNRKLIAERIAAILGGSV